jgi:CheY-like chemotaxis protein
VVGNGKEAVELFKKQDFDVILMDIEVTHSLPPKFLLTITQMPVLSGVQATKIIRTELPAEKQIPIIALTANAFSEDIKRYLSSGFTSVVTKPIQQEQLRKALIEIEKHQKVQLYSHSTTST